MTRDFVNFWKRYRKGKADMVRHVRLVQYWVWPDHVLFFTPLMFSYTDHEPSRFRDFSIIVFNFGIEVTYYAENSVVLPENPRTEGD